MRGGCLALLSVALGGSGALADGAVPQPGLYRIEVSLELPHLPRPMPFRTFERCVGEQGEAVGAVLSTPTIESCPLTARSSEGGVLTFERLCAKTNDGHAFGRFELADDGFDGWIALTLGGKNMRMTELQTAARVGDCPDVQGP